MHSTTSDVERTLLASIDEEQLLGLELASIRIPSSTFQEGELADFLANYMSDLGLDVRMMEVQHPWEPGESSRQPVARLTGTGGGPTLMLNGHMDPGIEMTGWSVDPYGGYFQDGWIWGMGAHDDKGGVAAMISAVAAIIRSGLRPKGDILICPVVAHKYGGIGTRALLAEGLRADMCINLEHSANTIANVCVGLVLVRIRTRSPELFFRFSDNARAAYWNPVEQICAIMQRLGPSMTPIGSSSWLSFTPHADLPGFPMICIDTISKDHYFHPKRTELSTRECEMTFQIRLVPGQTAQTVQRDLEALLQSVKSDYPTLSFEMEIPAGGVDDTLYQQAMETERDHPLVRFVEHGFKLATQRVPEIGGAGRIGNIGDGNILAAAGIPSVQFGPGDIRIYKEWPTPDERVLLTDLVDAARTIAVASWHIANGR